MRVSPEQTPPQQLGPPPACPPPPPPQKAGRRVCSIGTPGFRSRGLAVLAQRPRGKVKNRPSHMEITPQLANCFHRLNGLHLIGSPAQPCDEKTEVQTGQQEAGGGGRPGHRSSHQDALLSAQPTLPSSTATTRRGHVTPADSIATPHLTDSRRTRVVSLPHPAPERPRSHPQRV